jgi:hypothetical protein
MRNSIQSPGKNVRMPTGVINKRAAPIPIVVWVKDLVGPPRGLCSTKYS